ncbi:MAG TPA: molybdenum cofactor guanylyltransferase [Bacillota bacterium]|nr:molybdenum cofactor guanylyltransferase [Bacillota bacterium]HQE08976.1 molybdenum cofactor guanylyltransferase [Bacillota bacterium]
MVLTLCSCARLGGAIILAGGDSSRLGCPKPFLELEGESLIEIVVRRLSLLFEQITIVTDRQDLFAGLPVKLTGDLLTSHVKSPLRGIHAGLSVSDLPYQFVAACDMPFINLELVRYMAAFAPQYDAVVPRIGSYYQPLHAFYSRSCIEPIRKQVERGECKVTSFYDKIRVRHIGYSEIARFDPGQRSFFNVNTWADYLEAQNLLPELKRRQADSACLWGKEF